MTSGQFVNHCRSHMKAWISLVVIVQCLVLIIYLIVVSDKETTQQPPLVKQSHVITQNGHFIQSKGQETIITRGQITNKNQIKGSLVYPPEHPTHQRAIADHLNSNTNLKNANDILFRKIGSKKRKQNLKPAERKEEALKKALLQQARWAEKVERHRKQKLQGIKSRNRVNNKTIFGAIDLPQFDIKAVRENKNNSKLIGRELKKFTSDGSISTIKSKESSKFIDNGKLVLGSYTRFFVSSITDLVKEKRTAKEFTNQITNAKHEDHSNSTKAKNFSKVEKTTPIQTASISWDYNLTSIIGANLSLFTNFVSIPKVFHLDNAHPTVEYFDTRRTTYSTHQCYRPGTRPQIGPDDFLCSCERGWHGKWCSFPDSLYYSGASQ